MGCFSKRSVHAFFRSGLVWGGGGKQKPGGEEYTGLMLLLLLLLLLALHAPFVLVLGLLQTSGLNRHKISTRFSEVGETESHLIWLEVVVIVIVIIMIIVLGLFAGAAFAA